MNSGARSGSALFATLSALLVLVLLASTYVSYARHQARLSHRYVNAEAAHQLAQSGVAAVLARLTAPDAAPDSDVVRLLGGPASGLEGRSISLSSEDSGSALARIAGRYDAADQARVQVTATFRGWKPIYPEGFRTRAGVSADVAEKHGRIHVVAKASHGGVERELECHKAAKVIRPVLPVLPRFTLFAKRALADAELNLMEVEKRLIFPRPAGRVPAAATHDALVLANGPDPYTGGGLTPALDRSGWVFLGGDARWNFQLAFGGGEEPHADGHLLPTQSYRFSGEAEAEGLLAPEGQELMRTTFGLMKMKTGMFTGVSKDSRIFARYPFEEPVRCASLKPYGSAARPSPTVLLGRAYRRSLVYSYLTNAFSDPQVTRTAFLPCILLKGDDALAAYAALFKFGAPPFDEATVLQTLFSNSLTAYEPFASTVLEEPYARSLDHLESNLRNPGDPSGYEPPAAMTALPPHLERLDGNRGAGLLYDPEDNARVRLRDAENKELFAGDLDQLDAADLMLPERATYVFTRAQLQRWTEGGQLAVRGIMAADPREGDLVLDRPLEIVDGGVIVARGDIRIAAPITARAGGVPLALVSLEGRIVIATGRVDAQLVALSPGGSVTREGDGPLELRGSIAATTVDLAALAAGAEPGRVTKTLTWDGRADPVGRTKLPLRLYLDTGRTVTVR